MITPVGWLTCDGNGVITTTIDDPPWRAVSKPAAPRQLSSGMLVHLYPEPPDDDETITPTGQVFLTRDKDLALVRVYDDPPGAFYATFSGWVHQVIAGDRDRAGLVATGEPIDVTPKKTHIAVGLDVAAALRILAYRARQPQGGRPNYDATIRHLLRTHPDLSDLVIDEMKF